MSHNIGMCHYCKSQIKLQISIYINKNISYYIQQNIILGENKAQTRVILSKLFQDGNIFTKMLFCVGLDYPIVGKT